MVCHHGWDSLDPIVQHEVLLQELPYIRREHSRLEEAKESSAGRNDSSRRIRSCLPHNPCQSLYTLADTMCAQDP